MPAYTAPNSDVTRLAFLRRAHLTGTADRASAHPYLSEETLAALAALIAQFDTVYFQISTKQGARGLEVDEANAAMDTALTTLRDLWEVVYRRVHRKHESASVLNFYHLPTDGSRPNPTTRDEWLSLMRAVIEGDAAAVAAGYEAAVCPSAAELQTALTTAQTEIADLPKADRALDDAQAALATLRTQTDVLIQDVVDELRFRLRKLDGPSQRRIMRSYGAQFRTLPGETPEEGEAEPV